MDKNVGVTVWPYFEELKVAKLSDNAILPERNHVTDAGFDFYALRNTFVKSNHMAVVRTGITMEIPPAYFGLLKPKGGSDFLIGAGVIDSGYQGEILFKMYNYKERNVIIRAGDPIGQLVLLPIIFPYVSEVSLDDIHVDETDRGDTGGITEDVE
jgi:dUTP pyrophosphatase